MRTRSGRRGLNPVMMAARAVMSAILVLGLVPAPALAEARDEAIVVTSVEGERSRRAQEHIELVDTPEASRESLVDGS